MELNICFKNVKQGDTIFLDWISTKRDKRKFGLIDCVQVNGGIEPVVNHIREHKIREFEFVVMTHPHSDHFSGFIKFFEYCTDKGIVIKDFIHTSQINPSFLSSLTGQKFTRKLLEEFLLSAVNFKGHRNLLADIYNRLLKEEASDFAGAIKDMTAANNKPFLISKDIFFQFLSPQNPELKSYIKASYDIKNSGNFKMAEKNYDNNPAANLLSSFIRIFSNKGNWQVLLCSDITPAALRRIMRNPNVYNDILGKKTLVVQIPHHGSKKNHLQAFWQGIPGKEAIPSIISVGEGYNHPSVNVVKYFHENYKAIHSTNFVGGYKEFFSSTKYRKNYFALSTFLDMPGITFPSESRFKKDFNESEPCGEKLLMIRMVRGEASCKVTPSREYD